MANTYIDSGQSTDSDGALGKICERIDFYLNARPLPNEEIRETTVENRAQVATASFREIAWNVVRNEHSSIGKTCLA